jgi:hypothetical protein
MAACFQCLPFLTLVLLADDPSKWRVYESKEGKFSSKMPGTVKSQSQMQALPGGGSMTLYAHAVDMKDGAWMVAYADLPKGTAFNYTACVNAMTRTWDGKVLYQKPIKVAGNDGVEFEAKISKPADGWATGRVFVHKDRLYQLIVLGAKIRAKDKDVQQFWDSFKLLEK